MLLLVKRCAQHGDHCKPRKTTGHLKLNNGCVECGIEYGTVQVENTAATLIRHIVPTSVNMGNLQHHWLNPTNLL